MKKIVLIFAFLISLNVPLAVAQSQSNDAQRVKLATRMHQLKPVKPIVDATILGLSQQVAEAKREDFVNAMMLATDYDAVEKASIEAMAKSFTEDELKAMVAYYGSDAAKSAEAKMPGFLQSVQESVQKALDKAVLDAALKPENNPQKTAPKTP